MRRLALLLLLAPALAGDDVELLRLKRLAMEAHLKIGDALRLKGDVDGARMAYEAALRIREGGAAAPGVDLALEWLARNQEREGFWDCDAHGGGALYDVGVTSLALLAFLEAGHGEHGRYGNHVRTGLKYLVEAQDDHGVFGARTSSHFMYNTAIATRVLCEAARVNPRYKAPAQRGLNFLGISRNPYLAWRYAPRGGDNDTSVTAWCVEALLAGQRAGLDVDPDAFEGARLWIEKITDFDFGQAGYNFPGGSSARPEGLVDAFPVEKTQAMTATAIYLRVVLGEKAISSQPFHKGAKLCVALPPVWAEDGSIDMYFWYHATLALRYAAPADWETWSRHLKQALLGNQERKGEDAGSWDPADPWGPDGGRVYATALMALALQAEAEGRAADAIPR